MPTFLKTFQVNQGVIASERSPETPEDLYVTSQELKQLYGCGASDEDIRFAMSLINTHCNRASLWPCEIEEQKALPSDRQETRLSVTPVIRVLEAAGRYGFGRRDKVGYNQWAYGLGAVLALSGAKPQYAPIDVNSIDLMPETGVIYIPWSIYFATYTTIRVRYLAGWIEIPARVKTCIAEIINTTHAMGVSQRTSYTAGRVSRKYATPDFLSPMAQKMLQPFVVTALF